MGPRAVPGCLPSRRARGERGAGHPGPAGSEQHPRPLVGVHRPGARDAPCAPGAHAPAPDGSSGPAPGRAQGPGSVSGRCVLRIRERGAPFRHEGFGQGSAARERPGRPRPPEPVPRSGPVAGGAAAAGASPGAAPGADPPAVPSDHGRHMSSAGRRPPGRRSGGGVSRASGPGEGRAGAPGRTGRRRPGPRPLRGARGSGPVSAGALSGRRRAWLTSVRRRVAGAAAGGSRRSFPATAGTPRCAVRGAAPSRRRPVFRAGVRHRG